ncbi:MAG: hypothetical protein NT039_02800 [Candidatus Berkelbacteria bacterium]|nr:hypothetical protein [Candidatus Berkelbacteria bacterium]
MNKILTQKMIKKFYKEFAGQNDLKTGKEDFRKFLLFLEIDFYDWVQENLRFYFKEKYTLK